MVEQNKDIFEYSLEALKNMDQFLATTFADSNFTIKDLQAVFVKDPEVLTKIGCSLLTFRHYICVLLIQDKIQLDKSLSNYTYGPKEGYSTFSSMISLRYGSDTSLEINDEFGNYVGPQLVAKGTIPNMKDIMSILLSKDIS